MPHHPTDELRTGREIAMSVFQADLGEQKAKDLLLKLTGHNYPLEMVQKGHLTRLLEATEQEAAQNAELQAIVQSLRKQMSDKDSDEFADRVLDFCEKSRKAGKSALDTANNARTKFPDFGELGLVSVEYSGDSVELKLPHGPYISFDEAENVWTARGTSIFST